MADAGYLSVQVIHFVILHFCACAGNQPENTVIKDGTFIDYFMVNVIV